MTRNASAPKYREKFMRGRTVGYMFLPQVEPACNSRCTGCYIFSSETYNCRVRRSEEEIISDLRGLTAAGYSVIPVTTEILSNARCLEMLAAANSEYVLTNGRLIVRNSGILARLRPVGIRQIVVTANFENSGIRLTNPEFFRGAARSVQDAGFSLMARITLTRLNITEVGSMISECARIGVQCIQFLRFMPLEKGPATLTEADTENFFRLLQGMRKKYPGIYLSAGGSLGFQFRKKIFACRPGQTQVVIGLDNGIYPCIYLTQTENRIGTYENGELKIYREFKVSGNPSDCPAYSYIKNKQGDEIVEDSSSE